MVLKFVMNGSVVMISQKRVGWLLNPNRYPSFDIFHIVGTTEADAICNVERSRDLLGLPYQGDLEQYH